MTGATRRAEAGAALLLLLAASACGARAARPGGEGASFAAASGAGAGAGLPGVPEASREEQPRAERQLAAKPGDGFWSVRGTNFVDASGNIVYFSGVIWSGFETPDAIVQGLWDRTYQSHLDQMKALGFNLIRLPFAGDTLLPSTKPRDGFYNKNPELKGLTSLQVMDKIISACGERGIKVILDYHRIRLTISNENGLWFDERTPESVWINNWAMLAKRYKGNPTVIGADLFNEVHPGQNMPAGAPYWRMNMGKNEKYNFRSASVRVIKAINDVEPNWIMFLEGMHNSYWWGGNCFELLKAPITFPKGKIAYSSHEYGPYVYKQWWFAVKDFPANLVGMFRRRWGIVMEKHNVPVWIGEFGSFYPPNTSELNRIERITFTTLISYIKQLNASWTLAFWNPNSKDTGGILNDDWKTVNQEKLNLLKGIMHPNFGPSPK